MFEILATRPSRRALFVFAFTTVCTAGLLVILLLRLIAASQSTAIDLKSPLVGQMAADFTITTWSWDGAPSTQLHLSAFKGSPVVINFWAS